MIKFYSDIKNYSSNFLLTPKNYFDIFHNYFYFCLLPFKLKYQLLEWVNDESKKIFDGILKINYEFCDSVEESDCIMCHMPTIRDNINDTINYYHKISKNNKKIIVFNGSDNNNITYAINNIPNAILFTTSGFKSNCSKNVFGCPTLNDDYFNGSIMKKNLSLGFCGCPSQSMFRTEILEKTKMYYYTDFVLRNDWGNISNLKKYEKTISKKSKKEYINNIENNLYTFCMSGYGNFSFRLAEVFMMGRIPVLLDTDCILPFEDDIPYKTNTVYITKENSNNFQNIDLILKDYHNSHTEEELIRIQTENREIWLNYFKIDGSFFNTLKLLKKVI
jgi:hypothetical protein